MPGPGHKNNRSLLWTLHAPEVLTRADLGSLPSFSPPARLGCVGASSLGPQTNSASPEPPLPHQPFTPASWFFRSSGHTGSPCAVSPSLQSPPRLGHTDLLPLPFNPVLALLGAFPGLSSARHIDSISCGCLALTHSPHTATATPSCGPHPSPRYLHKIACFGDPMLPSPVLTQAGRGSVAVKAMWGAGFPWSHTLVQEGLNKLDPVRI